LYRHHTTIDVNDPSKYYKDLSKIGRNLTKMIMIDNCPDNFKFHQENGLYIKSWENDITDMQLIGLLGILVSIVEIGFEDIRDVIKIIKQEVTYKTVNTSINPYAGVDLYKLLNINSDI
jgi:CTD small phosphatase-like protein 2